MKATLQDTIESAKRVIAQHANPTPATITEGFYGLKDTKGHFGFRFHSSRVIGERINDGYGAFSYVRAVVHPEAKS